MFYQLFLSRRRSRSRLRPFGGTLARQRGLTFYRPSPRSLAAWSGIIKIDAGKTLSGQRPHYWRVQKDVVSNTGVGTWKLICSTTSKGFSSKLKLINRARLMLQKFKKQFRQTPGCTLEGEQLVATGLCADGLSLGPPLATLLSKLP